MEKKHGLVVITKRQAVALEAVRLLPEYHDVRRILEVHAADTNGWSADYGALNAMNYDTLRRAVLDGYSTDVRIKKITITRGEGPSELCGIQHCATTWEQANRILKCMAQSVPDDGGYEYTDFRIEFNNGEEFRGSYELKQQDVQYGDLYRKVKDFCEFYAGKCEPLPAHIKSDTVYQQLIRKHKQAFHEFLLDVLYPSAGDFREAAAISSSSNQV